MRIFWFLEKTDGLKNILLLNWCFIPTLLVSDCLKNTQSHNFTRYPHVHMAHFTLQLTFLLFRICFQMLLSCLIIGLTLSSDLSGKSDGVVVRALHHKHPGYRFKCSSYLCFGDVSLVCRHMCQVCPGPTT